MSSCVCVCMCNTTKLQKELQVENVLFLWLETGSFSETGKRLIVLVYECLRGMVLLLLRNLVKESVAAAKKIGQREKRVLEDDVFIENTRLVSGSKTQDLNLRAPT